jgi:hypothetical protein
MKWLRWRRSGKGACPAGWELGQAASQGLTTGLAAHIETCGRCATELRAMERLHQRARSLPARTIPAASRQRIVMALRSEAVLPRQPPRGAATRSRRWTFAATLGVAIAGGTLMAARFRRPPGERTLPDSPAPLRAIDVAPHPLPPVAVDAPPERAAPPVAGKTQRPAARHPRLSVATRATTGEAADRAAFEKGWQLFRSGDSMAAAAAFADLERQAAGDAIVEDALFWRGVALGRAGEKVQARAAVAAFVRRFPRSARAGQACASLGWMLVEAGDPMGARALFERAAHDRSEKVRASARRGLQAIEASDEGTPAPPDQPTTR